MFMNVYFLFVNITNVSFCWDLSEVCEDSMKKLVVFIPTSHKEEVKNSMFTAGAGQVGAYNSCSFEVVGIGQFRPLKGSNPYIGNLNEVEKVEEVRVEMVCRDECLQDVISAMRQSHPYEEPAFDIIDLYNDQLDCSLC